MTKSELALLVEQAYATYNQTLPVDDRLKTLYTAWSEILHDLELAEAKRAFVRLAVNAQFMPRPGDIRRAAINGRTKVPPFDDALVAWGKFLSLMQDVNSGVVNQQPASEAIRLTAKALGDAAYGMHTNADRDAFCRTYDKIVSQLDEERYAVPEVKES